MDATTPTFILTFLTSRYFNPHYNSFMISIILLSQNADTILVRDTLEEKRFATSQALTTVAALTLLQGYINPPQPSSSQCCFNIGTFVPPSCDFGNIMGCSSPSWDFGSCTGPTFDCATGGGDCSGGSSGDCSGGGCSGGDCSGGGDVVREVVAQAVIVREVVAQGGQAVVVRAQAVQQLPVHHPPPTFYQIKHQVSDIPNILILQRNPFRRRYCGAPPFHR